MGKRSHSVWARNRGASKKWKGRRLRRSILVNRVAQGYAGSVMYEALTVTGQTRPTIGAAVASVVEKLQEFGFTRIRTRPNFKGQRYLAEKETWVDYTDK